MIDHSCSECIYLYPSKMKKEFSHITLKELPQIAHELIELGKGHAIWRVDGVMGAGKTTLIKLIAVQLGVVDPVSSPTFSLVNEYLLPNGTKLFHFDFYRIRDLNEVYDIGYEDYFYSNNRCIIEWAEKIEPLLEEENVLTILIELESSDARKITIKG